MRHTSHAVVTFRTLAELGAARANAPRARSSRATLDDTEGAWTDELPEPDECLSDDDVAFIQHTRRSPGRKKKP